MKKFEFSLTVQVGVENIGLPSVNPLFQLRDKRVGRGDDGGGNAGEERVNCERDAKSDKMKNEQQTAVIDDQNGEEGRRTAKGSRKARRAGGTGNKAGIGRATALWDSMTTWD